MTRKKVLEYRPDIDWLRAVAVISVIGFHFELPGFGGGFVGVDIFFVISGYVISRLIWTGIQSNSFSFIAFYERRARRLLPALYLMIVVTGIVAWFFAPPGDYRMFFGSAVSTLLFSSNIFFWSQTGYFDLPTIGKVLIHTWSLSVEEQFYFLFPVVTWLWSRLFPDPTSKLSLGLVITGAVALCVLDELWIKQSPSAAFYIAPLRAWEFLIGSIAFFLHRWSPVRSEARLILATAGMGSMLIPVVIFRAETRFPGLHALIPCLGTAFYIVAFNQEQGRPRLPFRETGAFLGRLSYSLYLWHWPVFVLGRAALPLDAATSAFATAGLLLCSLLLAYLSYIIVERPARARTEWVGVRGSPVIAGIAVVLIAVGVHGVAHDGYADRFPQSQARMLRYDSRTMEPFYRAHSCFLRPDEPPSAYDFDACLKPAANKRNILLAGDSLAAHYAWGLRSYLSSDAYHLLQLTSGACPPFVELKLSTSRNCNDVNQLLRDQIRAHRFDGVVLSGNWRAYLETYGQPPARGVDRYLNALLAAAQEAGVPVLLLGPSIEFPAPLAPTLFNHEQTHVPIGNSLLPREGSFKADDRLKEIASAYPLVQYVSILDTICSKRRCPLTIDAETPIVWDTIHFTPEGSRFVLSQLAPQLDAFLRRLGQPSETGTHELVAGDGPTATRNVAPSQVQ
ncbi:MULTISPECIES: acyltransferase family protein [unclassified Bradyrhizobium]|uniref:acyltransferase family protein n=1 Tax=unclassified Bradyrhizobium TaxID=2631580 RepID=UPI0028E1FA20|nr:MULTISPECIES: acyltransferase family protein [unclassified Bradyrhizobium]